MTVHADFTNCDHFNGPYFDGAFRKFDGPKNPLNAPQSKTNSGFYRTQYPTSYRYMHKSLGTTGHSKGSSLFISFVMFPAIYK